MIDDQIEADATEGTEQEVPADFRQAALKAWGFDSEEPYPCASCSTAGRHELHHIVFRSRGGGNETTNLVPICRTDHDDIHNEAISLVWHEGMIVTFDNVLERIVCRTPWPPDLQLMAQIGTAQHEVMERLENIQGSGHKLIASQLPGVIAGVAEIGKETEKAILKLAHERMERAPERGRVAAAKALAVELAGKGHLMSQTTVRSLAGQYDVMNEVGEQLWDQTPKTIKALASWREPSEGAQIVHDWHDRPVFQDGNRETTQAFVARYKADAIDSTARIVDGYEAELCESCKGNGDLSEKDLAWFQSVQEWAQNRIYEARDPEDYPYKEIIQLVNIALTVKLCPECLGSGRRKL